MKRILIDNETYNKLKAFVKGDNLSPKILNDECKKNGDSRRYNNKGTMGDMLRMLVLFEFENPNFADEDEPVECRKNEYEKLTKQNG